MGNKVTSALIRRPVKNWNVENRAQSLIETQEKPTAAPRHPSTRELLDKFSHDHPELSAIQKTKNEQLAKMLHGMVVNPQKMGEIKSTVSTEPRVADRVKHADDEFGYLEPEKIRPGKCSIRQTLQFLGDHFTNPQQFNANVIASSYQLDSERVKLVLKYFQVFQIQLPGQQSRSSDDEPSTLTPGFAAKNVPESGELSDKALQKRNSEKSSDKT